MRPEASLRDEPASAGSPGGSATAPARSTGSQVEQAVEHAVTRATNWLLSQQNQDGYWWGELEADTTLESDYILYLHILGRLQSKKVEKLAQVHP